MNMSENRFLHYLDSADMPKSFEQSSKDLNMKR